MSIYPERRPYATTVPQSGYRAKPLVPQPPTDALTMLRSHVGYDDLRTRGGQQSKGGGARPSSGSTATSVKSAAGRTYAPSGSPGSNGAAANSANAATSVVQRVLPQTDRTAKAALEAAALQRPIEHAAHTYHGCQQPVLNAQLRETVETLQKQWLHRLHELQRLVSSLPAESAQQSSRDVEALVSYWTGYRCTDDVTVTGEQLLQDANLRTPLTEVRHMAVLATMPVDAMRRSLDDLLRSPYLLAPLDTYVNQLGLLDRLSALSWPAEGDHTAVCEGKSEKKAPHRDEESSGADASLDGTVEEVCPSRTAVALHERLHYNPGDYSERELKRSEEALYELQQHVRAVKQQKEDAIDAGDPLTALRSLHAQVDFSNDLLLMYKARLALVQMHAEDVLAFRQEVVDLVEDGRRAALAVQQYARHALPSVHHDIRVLSELVANEGEALENMRGTDVEAEAEMQDRMSAFDTEALAMWQEVQALLQKVNEKAQEKAAYVQHCMKRREQRAKEVARAAARFAAEQEHQQRLCRCEEILLRWQDIGGVYDTYVEACVPKLLTRLTTVEDTNDDLAQREAEEYVGYFEQFVYAAEEARAKRRTQADRMRLLQRSTELNHACAEETLDPQGAAHAQRLADAAKELAEVQQYLQYVSQIEEDRRSEVNPVLQRVLVRHAQAQLAEAQARQIIEPPPPSSLPTLQVLENAPAGQKQPVTPDVAATTETGMAGGGDSEGVVAAPESHTPSSTAADSYQPNSTGGDAVGALTTMPSVAPPSSVTATIAHPLVAARQIGLLHEDLYLAKQEQLTEQELREVEARQTGLRRSKEELRAMAAKYKNMDDVRALLGLP